MLSPLSSEPQIPPSLWSASSLPQGIILKHMLCYCHLPSPCPLTSLPGLVSACLSSLISCSFLLHVKLFPISQIHGAFQSSGLWICSSPCLKYLPPLSLPSEPLSPVTATLSVTSSRILSQVHQLWYSFVMPLVSHLCFPFLTVGFSEAGASPYPFFRWTSSLASGTKRALNNDGHTTTNSPSSVLIYGQRAFFSGWVSLHMLFTDSQNQDVQKQNSFPSLRLRISESPSLIILTVSCSPL